MDLSRRKLLASAAYSSTIGLSGCLDPDEGTALDIWLGGDEERGRANEPDPEPEPRPDDEVYRGDNRHENFHGFCDTSFKVPKNGAIYFRENSEVVGGARLEGVVSDNDDGPLKVGYLNEIKHLDYRKCFNYTPGGFRDFDHGDWHARCFEVIQEYDDSYLVETEAIKDVAGPDERISVPICIYDSDN